MTAPLIDRSQYDHPEHFDDDIRAYRTSARYIPTPLESLLYELCGHRCAICAAPWLEIHHIDELNEGGRTEYSNLIVLCPNCHTRVHQSGVPSKQELRHYKLKQEIAYELPILSRLSDAEKEFVKKIARLTPDQQLLFYERHAENRIITHSAEEAIRIVRSRIGLYYLEESGIVTVPVERVDFHEYSPPEHEFFNHDVILGVRVTSKGLRWIRYVTTCGYLSVV